MRGKGYVYLYTEMFRMASYYNAKSHLEKRYFKEDLECLSRRLSQIRNRKNPFYKCLLNKTELPKNNPLNKSVSLKSIIIIIITNFRFKL